MNDKEKRFEKLLNDLEKEHFDSLSYNEQTELLSELVDMIKNDNIDATHLMIGMKTQDDTDVIPVSIKDFIDHLGKEGFIEVFRKVIHEGGLQSEKYSSDEIENILSKARKDGTDGMSLIEKAVVSSKLNELNQNDPEDINFSTFALLTTISSLLTDDSFCKPEKVSFVGHLEVEANLLYVMSVACALLDDKNVFAKTYKKHGFGKAVLLESDLVSQLSNLIVGYCSENNINPELTVIALAHIIKVLTSALPMSVDGLDDTTEEYLRSVLSALTFPNDDNSNEISSFLNNEDTSNKSPNGDNKDIKKEDKIDIRKLLLED
jgi:hypothetical protein